MNWKRFAIKFADLKDQTTYNQINKVFGYLVDFPMDLYPNPGFTSTKAELIYQWTLTISESALPEDEKISILNDAIDDLLTNEEDKVMMKNTISLPEITEKVIIKEVIQYIEKQTNIQEISLSIDEYLPITFFDEKNNEFKEKTILAYQSNVNSWNHQFAYIAYYMLFVSYLYKVIWQLKTIWDTAIINEIESFVQTKLERDLNIIFDLSWIKEDEFCRKVNTFIRCLHTNETDEIVNFVQKRNHCSHPSGMIQYSKSEVDNLIQKIDTYTKKIQDNLDRCLVSYVKSNLEWFWTDNRFMLSRHEILFLYEKRFEILNFNSDTRENLDLKIRFIKIFFWNPDWDFLPENYSFELVKLLFTWYQSGQYSIYETLQLFDITDNKKEIVSFIESICIDQNEISQVRQLLNV